MIDAKIDKTTLLNLFMDRLECWVSDDELELYESYLRELIDCGCFDGSTLDIDLFADNLYFNDTVIMDKEQLDYNGIEVYDREKILAKNENKDLYLVGSY